MKTATTNRRDLDALFGPTPDEIAGRLPAALEELHGAAALAIRKPTRQSCDRLAAKVEFVARLNRKLRGLLKEAHADADS